MSVSTAVTFDFSAIGEGVALTCVGVRHLGIFHLLECAICVERTSTAIDELQLEDNTSSERFGRGSNFQL